MEQNSSIDAPYVDLWIRVLDELTSWLISLNTVVYLSKTPSGPGLPKFHSTVVAILSKLISDCLSIRELISLGFDVQAKVLVRSAGEYAELLVAILDDPQLGEEFHGAQLPEDANHFWHKNLSKKKIRSKIKKAWQNWISGPDSEAVNSETTTFFAEWGDQHSGILGALSHPSFMAGFLSAIPMRANLPEDDKWIGFFGLKSDWSVDTVYFLACYLFPVLLLSPNFPFNGYRDYMAKTCPYNEKDELHWHVKKGRSVLASLILSLVKESNRSHVFPDIDMSIYGEEDS